MKQLILHIPHASIKIPFLDGFIDDMDIINSEILKLTDWQTEDLFYSSKDISVIADYSRIFCDPERFSDYSLEVMAKLDEYYIPHHARLNEAVAEILRQFSHATIIDCHSFSDTPFIRDQNQNRNRPDFRIGTNPFHTPQLLVDQ